MPSFNICCTQVDRLNSLVMVVGNLSFLDTSIVLGCSRVTICMDESIVGATGLEPAT